MQKMRLFQDFLFDFYKKTIYLSCTVYEMYCRTPQILPTPSAFGALVGVTSFEFHKDV